MYKDKYIKYKTKYINLKNVMDGGGGEIKTIEHYVGLIARLDSDDESSDNNRREYNKKILTNLETATINENFINKCFDIRSDLLKRIPDIINSNRQHLLWSIKRDDSYIDIANVSFLEDRSFMLEAAKINGKILRVRNKFIEPDNLKLNEKYKSDKEMMLAGITSYPELLESADQSLIKDNTFILEAIEKNNKSIEFVPDNYKEDEKLLKTASKTDHTLLRFAKGKLLIKINEWIEVFKKTCVKKYKENRAYAYVYNCLNATFPSTVSISC